MDLSVNRFNKGKIDNLDFKGVKSLYASDNVPVYRFYAPAFKKSEENASLEIVRLAKDSKGNYIPLGEPDIIDFEGDNPIEIEQEVMKELSSGAFAYRYIIQNKNGRTRYLCDDFKTQDISNKKMNIIEQGQNYGITPKMGTMRHSFIDSDCVLNPDGTLAETNKDFVRNHFNKLGGSIKGLIYLLKHGEFDQYRYIISTPDIGVDPISSHKYWPNNQYQCSNLQDFKDFNFELFKEGKGYVADGAFTSQGIQSPLVHHVLKWGENSPFYNMLKIDGQLQLGILPNVSDNDSINPYEYIGVKIVNPKGENYDSKKPTYIQFFDSRLSSKKQQESNELIKSYDNQLKDHYDIVSHQDSVEPYYFEIDPNDPKASVFKNGRTVRLMDIKSLEDFLVFPNYKITDKQHASGASYWDGNTDIIKMNLSNPDSTSNNRLGLKDARNYLYGVASYWSETIQSDLILRTALSRDKKSIALKNEIPESDWNEINNAIDNSKDIVFEIIEQNKKPIDYVKQFPLQSIETSPELSAIFSQPQFNKEFFDENTAQKIAEIVENTISSIVPNEYKDNEEYKIYAAKVYANTIIRTILASAMSDRAVRNGEINLDELKNVTLKSFQSYEPSTVEQERKQVENKIKKNITPSSTYELSTKLAQELKDVSLKDFKLAESIVKQGRGGLNWRFDAAKDIGDIDSIRDGSASFQEIWYGDSQNPGLESFWTNFVSRVRQYNPSAYIVAEVTNMYDMKTFSNANNEKGRIDKGEKQIELDFLSKTGATTGSNYDKYFNNLTKFIGVDPENGYDSQNLRGNLSILKQNTESLISESQPHVAMLSHVFTDNHDKPRILHTLPLNMPLYLKGHVDKSDFESDEKRHILIGDREDYYNISSKAVAVGEVMYGAIERLYGNDNDKKQALLSSLKGLINGRKTPDALPNFKRAEAFGTLPYEVTIRDLFKNAGIYDEEEMQRFNWDMIQYAAWDQERLWQVINALTGVPTLYNGTEFAQTGYETSSKNVYLGNRGQILHDLKNKEGYSAYYNKMRADFNLYRQPGLSAIRSGFPVSLSMVDGQMASVPNEMRGAFDYFVSQIRNNYKGDLNSLFDRLESLKDDNYGFSRVLNNDLKIDNNYNNHENFKKLIPQIRMALNSKISPIAMWPIYRYDEQNSKVISVITNYGIKLDESNGHKYVNRNPIYVSEIPIQRDGQCPLEENTELKRKIYNGGDDYVTEDVKYIVKNGKIKRLDNKQIKIDDTVSTFYVPNPLNKQVEYRSN